MTQLTNWQRLEAVILFSKLTTNAFAKKLSLKRSENLYQIKKGNNGISKELADLVVNEYPMIDKLWLLTGDGEMFTSKDRSQKLISPPSGVPYYEADLETVLNKGCVIAPSCYISMPMVLGCEFAVKFYGNAMMPDIAPGAVIFAMRCDPKIIIYGQSYLVQTPSCSVVRIVKKGPDEGTLRLVALNEEYEEVEIERSDIEAIFIIKGVFQGFV